MGVVGSGKQSFAVERLRMRLCIVVYHYFSNEISLRKNGGSHCFHNRIIGDPQRNRTSNLRIRNPLLYPVELGGRLFRSSSCTSTRNSLALIWHQVRCRESMRRGNITFL
jgi:hypothetical protein